MTVDGFISHVANSDLRGFFHFTDTRNLESIKQHGLLSLERLRSCGIVPITGGNDWSLEADKGKGMDRFVHLCFRNSHGMVYVARQRGSIQRPVYLHINPDVLRLDGVMMTLGVSNKSAITPLPAADLIPELDLEVIYSRTNWNDPEIKERLKAAERCEILVPDCVPLKFIRF